VPSGPTERYDFFLSRRGSVAAIAQEVEQVLAEKGYNVCTQDYDMPLGSSFVEGMHEGIKNSRDLIILFTRDYEQSRYTREEFASFAAQRLQDPDRHVVILRCEDAPLEGLLADKVYQDLVGVDDPEQRKLRIIAAAERQSQGVPPPPRPFIGVPPRIASFTGRADALDRLDAILIQDKPAAVTQATLGRAAVHGMGGVGKTSLAVEYAHRFRGLYAGVCWCPAETRTGLLSALASLAVTLGAVSAEEADVEKAAKAALRRLAEQRATWLLVYDNVTAPDQIADLLPSAGARVLITSRFSDWSEMADEVPLDVLSLGEAVALLESRTGRSDPQGARTLAEALGCLPLALDHAAAYSKRMQVRFEHYATKASGLIDAAPRGAGYPRSVAATFDLAVTEAVSQCPAAEPLMAYLAQCAPGRIPMTLVEGAVEDEAERLQALAALAEVWLLKHDPFEDGSPAVTVHRLVQAVARTRSEEDGSARFAVGRVIARLVTTYPEDAYTDPRSWSLCAQLTPHVLSRRGHDDTSLAALLDRAGGYLHRRAAYSQAALVLRDAVAIREKALGPEHPDTAASLNNLATLLVDQGDLTGSRTLFERALAIREKALGPEHPDTAASLQNLANILSSLGDRTRAPPLFERALAIREKALGPEHPETATSLASLAVLLNKQRDYSGAHALIERTLAIREKALGPEYPDTAASLHNLAVVLRSQGDLTGSRTLLERALAIRERAFGPEHPETASSLFQLAHTLSKLGDLTGSRSLFERVLEIREKVLGAEHPHTAESLSDLAFELNNQADYAGARALFERALAIREKALGPEHPETAASLNNLSFLLEAQGDLAGARTLVERALTMHEKALGPEHPGTSSVRCNLSRLWLLMGRPSEALSLGETALNAFDKVLGRGDAETKVSARVTAYALDALGRAEEAKALRERYGVTEPEKPKVP
jgi:tetratricopeptide (TPR) repeat protein